MVAGYRDQVKACWFAQNPGLERRFRWSYSIEPSSALELAQIFHRQARVAGYNVIANCLSLVPPEPTKITKTKEGPASKKRKRRMEEKEIVCAGQKFFEKHLKKFQYGGGDTETFLDKCKMINEKRTIAEPKDEAKINDIDVEKGLKEYLEYVEDRQVKPDTLPEDVQHLYL